MSIDKSELGKFLSDEDKHLFDPMYLRCRQCNKLQHWKKLNLVTVKLSTEKKDDCTSLNITFCPNNPECKQRALQELLDNVELVIFNFVEFYE